MQLEKYLIIGLVFFHSRGSLLGLRKHSPEKICLIKTVWPGRKKSAQTFIAGNGEEKEF